MLLNIIVPKEIFKTETGELMVWSSKHYVPVETTVKDYILLGDLHARFTRREARSLAHCKSVIVLNIKLNPPLPPSWKGKFHSIRNLTAKHQKPRQVGLARYSLLSPHPN
jgi:hypothetical protein